MKQTPSQIVQHLTTSQLMGCVSDVKTLRSTGKVREGELRKLSRSLQVAGVEAYQSFRMAEELVLKEAAFRWLEDMEAEAEAAGE